MAAAPIPNDYALQEFKSDFKEEGPSPVPDQVVLQQLQECINANPPQTSCWDCCWSDASNGAKVNNAMSAATMKIVELSNKLSIATAKLAEVERIKQESLLKQQLAETQQKLAETAKVNVEMQLKLQAAPVAFNVNATNIAPSPDPSLVNSKEALLKAQLEEIERNKKLDEESRAKLEAERYQQQLMTFSEKDKLGRNALHRAVLANNPHDVRTRAAYKELLEVRDTHEDSTPFLLAAREGHKEICQILHTARANVAAITSDKERSALHIAAKHYKGKGHKALIEWLMEQFPYLIDAKDYKGRTPYKFAREHGLQEVCKILNQSQDTIVLVSGEKPDTSKSACCR